MQSYSHPLHSQPRRIADYVLITSAAGLLAIWPLPETMALRNFLYLLGVTTTLLLLSRRRGDATARDVFTYAPLVAFFAWIVVHYLFLSELKDAQFHELTGFWLRAFMAMVIGIGGGKLLAAPAQEHAGGVPAGYAHRIVFAALFGSLIAYVGRYGYEIFVTKRWLHTDFYMTPFKGKPQVVIFICILLTAVFARISEIIDSHQKYKASIPYLGVTILCLFVFYTANTKNGFLMFIFLLLPLCIVFLRKTIKSRQIILVFLMTLLPLSVVIQKHIEANPTWKMIVPDMRVGIDIDNQRFWKNWIDEPLPVNEFGVQVGGSLYLRTAWIVAAAELIYEKPLGYGLMSYSFSYLAKKKWPDFYSEEGNHMVATHSGWVDLTLAFGWPAILLLLFSLWRSFVLSLGRNGFWYRYIRWTVPLITFSYLTVEVSFDVFFELLLFFAGLFATLTSRPQQPRSLGKPRVGGKETVQQPVQ